MRLTFVVFLIGIILIAGCKQQPNYSFGITNDTKSGNEAGDISDTDSITVSWSKKFRDKLTQDCITKVSETVSAAEASRYCNCLTGKVEVKYPDEDQVESNLSQADIESMKPDCLALTSQKNTRPTGNSQVWSAKNLSEWMDNCTPEAGKTLGRKAANDYCDCMMKKLMKEYPDSRDISGVSQAHLDALASDCLGK